MVTSYSVDNDRKFRDAIQRAADATGDLRVPFGQILKDFYKSEQAIFALKGPGQYPPFKHSVGAYVREGRKRSFATETESPYQKWKKKHYGFDYPLLVRTGKLAASVTKEGSPGSIALIGKTELVIGTSVPYGIYHQSDDTRTKMPLRKFLFIGPEAPQFATSEMQGRPERWMNILNDWVLQSSKASGAFDG